MNFRKISFSIAAKHAGLGENDFLKSFSPKTNAPFILFSFYGIFGFLNDYDGIWLVNHIVFDFGQWLTKPEIPEMIGRKIEKRYREYFQREKREKISGEFQIPFGYSTKTLRLALHKRTKKRTHQNCTIDWTVFLHWVHSTKSL